MRMISKTIDIMLPFTHNIMVETTKGHLPPPTLTGPIPSLITTILKKLTQFLFYIIFPLQNQFSTMSTMKMITWISYIIPSLAQNLYIIWGYK